MMKLIKVKFEDQLLDETSGYHEAVDAWLAEQVANNKYPEGYYVESEDVEDI